MARRARPHAGYTILRDGENQRGILYAGKSKAIRGVAIVGSIENIAAYRADLPFSDFPAIRAGFAFYGRNGKILRWCSAMKTLQPESN